MLETLQKFQPIADEHGITLAQLTIAWTVAQPGVTHALVGARNAAQARENAAAGDVVLSGEELKTMDEAIEGYLTAVAGR
jgi:aryl-alcohol dehydrogenase-like predicted oxidoreductase